MGRPPRLRYVGDYAPPPHQSRNLERRVLRGAAGRFKQVWSEDFEDYLARDRAIEELAWQWLANDSDAQAKVSELLGQHQLDETAFEAQAFRMRAEDLEKLDYMLSRAEHRRERLLAAIAAYRDVLGKLVRQVSDQLLEQVEPGQVVAIVKRGG